MPYVTTVNPETGKEERRETFRCLTCKDAGWLRYDVAVGHPDFNRLVECPDCSIVQERRFMKGGARAIIDLPEDDWAEVPTAPKAGPGQPRIWRD
jgi:hypothetical protein